MFTKKGLVFKYYDKNNKVNIRMKTQLKYDQLLKIMFEIKSNATESNIEINPEDFREFSETIDALDNAEDLEEEIDYPNDTPVPCDPDPYIPVETPKVMPVQRGLNNDLSKELKSIVIDKDNEDDWPQPLSLNDLGENKFVVGQCSVCGLLSYSKVGTKFSTCKCGEIIDFHKKEWYPLEQTCYCGHSFRAYGNETLERSFCSECRQPIVFSMKKNKLIGVSA